LTSPVPAPDDRSDAASGLDPGRREVSMTIKTVAVVLGLVVSIAGSPLARAQAPAAPARTPAAKVGDEVIDLSEVEKPLKARLAQIEQQRFELLRQHLDQLVAERLLAQEAKRRNISVDELLKQEVAAKTPEVSEDEVTEFMTQNRARLPRGDEAELKRKVTDYLRAQAAGEQRQAFVDLLRTKTPVTVYLEEPASSRVPVRSDVGFVRGPADAPVVIVEFSDFQCPYCKNVVATVKQVLEKYPGKVKWIFRDFPLAQLHPDAPKAHEAARCAGAQGKFWEYHDVLFEKAPRLRPADLKQYADDLKLDAAAFGQCLDSGRFAPAVASDLAEGNDLGISGTPTFYVNGRTLVGAQPYSAFQQAIESELTKKRSP
jgi:protein-disulfide isomerase